MHNLIYGDVFMPSVKKNRREKAIKKAKLKRNILIAVIGVLVLGTAAAIIISAIISSGTETYSDGSGQSLNLYSNGTFDASLYHGNKYSGTYVRNESGVELTYNEYMTVQAWIDGDTLYLPAEWDDGHGHGSTLTKR